MANYIVHSLLRARDWQHRPQLDTVCDWWRGGGRGVCALIGMGGAGKTAVAERFLRLLPGGLPDDPGVDKDPALPTPNSTFVFSFYDAPNADAFFESLQMWLQNSPQVETLLSVGQMLFILQQRQGLIVLDGLERVQDDGQRGEFGRLHSPRLRDFLNQLAGGNFSDLSVLITSRFPLADLRDRNPRFFHPIPVNQIDIAAGVQLLKDRGVRGTDPQLAQIVEQCGRHALTVDFAGGYIAEYGQGDPATPLDLGTAEMSRPDQAQRRSGSDDESPEHRFARSGLLATGQEFDELDEDQREVLRQGYRFARIAEHYRDAMLQKDEAAMALLERICLFRLGVESETLAAIFTGEQAVEVSGPALAGLNREQLQSKLDWLVRMRIVESSSPVSPRPDAGLGETRLQRQYSIHPAVRDGFLSGISRDAAVAGHEAVRKGLEVSLGDAPGENPSDPATLDLLEEIVHHTLQSGHVIEAWDIYRSRLGGGRNLVWRLGAYERGERICRAFAGGQSPEILFSRETRQEFRRNAVEGMNAESPGNFRDDDKAASPRLPTDGDAPATSLPLPLGEGRGEGAALRRMPFLDLPEAAQAVFIGGWGLYLKNLGRLAAAARCHEHHNEMQMRQKDWKNASAGIRNLCHVWLLSGRLSRLPKDKGGSTAAVGGRKDETDESLPPSSFGARPSDGSPATSARLGTSSAGALATADEALRLAELADDAEGRRNTHAFRGNSCALRGEVTVALTDFRAALKWQQEAFPDLADEPLWSLPGTWHTQLLAHMGRREEVARLTNANQEVLRKVGGDYHVPQCQLVLSSLSIERSVFPSSSAGSSADLWTQARDWALARDAKEVLCWSCLVEAQHALAKVDSFNGEPQATASSHEAPRQDADACGSPLNEARTALESGLKIARDCGYGLYHIDLLLERARLHLLRGDAQAALDDIDVALDTGISANDETGQPELLAARHEACGYAWAIPAGLQLRAEALLLQAAREIRTDAFVPAKLNELPAEVAELIDDAKQLLHAALQLWQPLHDPEPERDDQNFKLDGKQYNYKAADTHHVLTQLEGGILTRYPLTSVRQDDSDDQPVSPDPAPRNESDAQAAATFDVFLSHNSSDKPAVRRLKKRLVEDYSLSAWLDEEQLPPGQSWQKLLEDGIRNSVSVAVLIGGDGIGPWEEMEMRAALNLAVNRKLPVIPVLLPEVSAKPQLPLFLADLTWVDLRDGLKKDGLDQLVWGITGRKPAD